MYMFPDSPHTSEAADDGLGELLPLPPTRYGRSERGTGARNGEDRAEEVAFVGRSAGGSPARGRMRHRGADPYQLENVVASASAEELGSLHDRLEVLKSCASATCRTTEGP